MKKSPLPSKWNDGGAFLFKKAANSGYKLTGCFFYGTKKGDVLWRV